MGKNLANYLFDVLGLLNLLGHFHSLEDVMCLPLVLDLLDSLIERVLMKIGSQLMARNSIGVVITVIYILAFNIHQCLSVSTCMAWIEFCQSSRSYLTGTFLSSF